MIAIIDYRAGNLTSVERALHFLGEACQITDDPTIIATADRVIFPGVGAAGEAMRNLNRLGLSTVIHDVVAAGKPFLGICLGYQILFDSSEEDGGVECLGVFPGTVVRFADDMTEADNPLPLKIPEMGWNGVTFVKPHPVTHGVPADAEFYFVHSYYPVPGDEGACALTTYGVDFASGVAAGSAIGFQFHPEKSGEPGLQLLRGFCAWNPNA
ncbi:MAG: imidazole glycerol phosphate synthase subunit HisH [Lentisphaeria bacterium]|nr:imidazole glycerol phosphate synthase subunit HisH [Lentisphaeria bacterium]